MTETPKSKPGTTRAAKVITISALSVVIGFGLCSVGFVNSSGQVLFIIGALAFWGGLLCLALSLLWLFIVGGPSSDT
jgi:hypothetical protein